MIIPMKKGVLITSVTIIIIFLVAFFIWRNYKNSAEYAIKQIKSSIVERNSLKFERYVNLDAICEQTIDASLQQIILDNFSESQTGFEALGSAIGLGLIEKLKPTLVSLLRSSIVESVESGDFNELYNKKDLTNNVSLKVIEDVFEISPNNIDKFEELRIEGNIGYFELRFKIPVLDTTLPIRFKMEKVNDNWILNGFYNIDKYLADLKHLKEMKLASVNYMIRET